jgi:UDP-N-acetylglucosamine 4-epimerase
LLFNNGIVIEAFSCFALRLIHHPLGEIGRAFAQNLFREYMSHYQETTKRLVASPGTWLVTGAAGFIGSNLVETLVQLGQRVVGLDNFSSGYQKNLEEVQRNVGADKWKSFRMFEADIADGVACERACAGVDYVLHQAAMGSVPRSIVDPVATNESNVTGFVNMLDGARKANVKRFVFASSSSVYGDHSGLPKVEEHLGNCLSPYAVSKRVDELYAGVFSMCYGMECVGLRYFNVFGPRQDPKGSYAAVIPKWISAMLQGESVEINGDGETSRDFCYVADVVQANILSAATENPKAVNQIFNIAVGERTTLNELFRTLQSGLMPRCPRLKDLKPVYLDFRPGDVRHSEADISKARELLGYEPAYRIRQGLDLALAWFVENCGQQT